jgi:hypothetical protein
MNAHQFGIDATTANPPWAIILSFALYLGIFTLGFGVQLLLSNKRLQLFESRLERIFFSPILGSAILGGIIYPALLFTSFASIWLAILAVLLIALALVFTIFHSREITFFLHNLPDRILSLCKISKAFPFSLPLVILILSMSMMTIGPPTDGDELDYHMGIPLAILKSGTWLFAPEWFHSRLAGMGEGLIALGMSVGAEQFGASLQFSGLLAIAILLIASNKNSGAHKTLFLYPLVFCS